MSAPTRWLDDTAAPTNEREILQAGLAMDPPADARGAVWAALLAKVPPAGGPPQGHGPAAGGKAAALGKAGGALGGAGAAIGGGILKSALIGAGSAVALIVTYSVVTPSPIEPPPLAAVPVAPRSASSEAARVSGGAATPLQAPQPSAAASGDPSAPVSVDRRAPADPRPTSGAAASAAPTSIEHGDVGPPADRETLLREESRLVAEARAALRRGDAVGALGLLEQIRARFPGGVLAQEREALSIEALAQSGQRAAAAARAAAFQKAYPASPLGAHVQTFAH